jgi:type VI secretion system protein ImpC
MPDSSDGRMRFDFSFKSGSEQEASEESLRIAILGDFGGSRAGVENQSSDPLLVDCDNFDEVFAKIGVTLDLALSEERSSETKLRFRKLEDLHPDQLLARLEPLVKLTELRARLSCPDSSNEAARELREVLKIDALPAEPSPATSTESTEALLSRLLGKPAAKQNTADSPGGLAHRLIEQLVGSNVPSVHPQELQLAALAEAELSASLRAILHAASFQALEATWRGLDFLVRNTSQDVKLYIIDFPKIELARVLATEDLAKSAIYKQLERMRPGMVLGVYTFGPEDNPLLERIARLAASCHTAFVAGASPHLIGCSSFGVQTDPDDWSRASSDALEEFAALRRRSEAAHLGLAMPRFLLRQPYGKGSDAIETFPFEEMTTKPEHESYLWGNPAFLCGQCMADAFATQGLEMEGYEAGSEVSGLPIHQFTSDGETQVKPCAEAWLSERAAAAILSRGIMPVLSIRGRDAVQLLTLRSISDPPMALAVRREFNG